jgi:3-phosphoshikimate 1-carboxyvinyltransferase
MPDERLGERACAFVVRNGATNGGDGKLDLAAVRSFLDAREVSRHYWPERVVEIEAMPRTPSGKIQKFVLRERARELRAEGTTPIRDESKERVS